MAADRLPWLAFSGACLIWGTTFLAIALGNASLPPFWAATLRLVVAGALLSLIVVLTRQSFPRGAALTGALLFGVFNNGLDLALLYWGERPGYVPSGMSAVLFATVPLSTVLLAWMFGLERPTWRRTLGAVIALAGVATVFAGELVANVPLVGLLAILAAATAAAVSGVMVKRAPNQSAVALNAVACWVGSGVCLLFALVAREDLALPQGTTGWFPVLYLAVLGSMGAYVLWTWLIQRWPASSASMTGVVAPMIAVAVGAVLHAERPPAVAFLGAALVLAGVVLVVRAPAPAARDAPRESTPEFR